MSRVIKFLGSVRFTVLISVALILLLIVSTSMEALNGTPFAQKVFYQTHWFDMMVALLWVNIFVSTVLRFPFKRNQLGFLVTHIGILVLLAGALVTRTHAMSGDLAVYEGETSDSVKQDGFDIALAYPNQEEARFELKKGDFFFALTKERLNAAETFCPLQHKSEKPKALDPKAEGVVAFSVIDVLPHVAENMRVTQGNDNGPVNHAIEVKVQSKQMAQSASLWLLENVPGDPSSADGMAGPVKVLLRQHIREDLTQKPVLKVLDKKGQEILSIDVEAKDIAKKILVAKTGMVIKDLVYYPYATVGQKGIINFPEGKKLNPAVVYKLVDAKGVETRHISFAYFPDFESMHPKNDTKAPGVDIRLDAGEPSDAADLYDGLQVIFHYGDKDLWQYQAQYQNKIIKEGDVSTSTCTSSGWMDVEFCPQVTLSRARVSYDIAPSSDVHAPMAVAVTLPAVSGTEVYWVFENKPTPVRLPKGEVSFYLAPKTSKLPFTLTLKQFRKTNYPGTMEAAGFESDVVLTDPRQGITLQRTISMNHPLEYDGYKIFQASYMNDPKSGNGSVLTVAKDPGIPWIYAGSIVACLGALLLFYWTKREETV